MVKRKYNCPYAGQNSSHLEDILHHNEDKHYQLMIDNPDNNQV